MKLPASRFSQYNLERPVRIIPLSLARLALVGLGHAIPPNESSRNIAENWLA